MRNRKNLAPTLSRRRALALLGGMFVTPKALAQVAGRQAPATPFAPAVPGYTLRFPRDEGSHPGFRTEWWYVTGWLENNGGPV
jgi:predicted secreted hydrolase